MILGTVFGGGGGWRGFCWLVGWWGWGEGMGGKILGGGVGVWGFFLWVEGRGLVGCLGD